MQSKLKVGLTIGALGVALLSGVFMGEALARQRHMQAAVGYLQEARDELQDARHNKGGHRVEALRLTNAAIAETRAGMDSAEDW
ncbi:MAG: hypothetical protein HY243_18120 [Proteobacteria bacterium]|nr:hypothetical protein [Pseudomonadota bacterium]